MGSKGGTTQQTSSSSGPPPQVMAEYQGLVDRATNVANQPYQPYQGELVAPLTSQTEQGLGGINQYANAAQPYLGAAGALTMGASAPVNPAQFQGMGSLSPFMNPFTSSVVDTTQAEMNNQNQQQAQFLNSANISSGAFGGDRAGIGQSILANQQQLAEAPTIAGLNQANFSQAMQDWTGQQSTNLAAQQANRSAQLAGGAQLGQIGLSAQEAGLQGAQANIQAGTIPQQEQQLIDNAAQQMYQQGQAYPFTTTGWLGNIIEGVGGQSGGQSQTTSPGPNSITQGLGAASQGVGLLTSLMSLSDERAKENVEEIGKTYDGQNIYRYNFKGDPRTQIGLLAQEEAYHHPGAVQRVGMGDLLGIDYHSATDDAAERGHYADGGAPDQGPPPGGMTQGVTQGIQPQQHPQEMSPGQTLMFTDPNAGARLGMGSFGLMGGTSQHPLPETAYSGPSRPPSSPVPLGANEGSTLSPLGSHLPSIFPSQPQSQGSGAAFGGRIGFDDGGGIDDSAPTAAPTGLWGSMFGSPERRAAQPQSRGALLGMGGFRDMPDTTQSITDERDAPTDQAFWMKNYYEPSNEGKYMPSLSGVAPGSGQVTPWDPTETTSSLVVDDDGTEAGYKPSFQQGWRPRPSGQAAYRPSPVLHNEYGDNIGPMGPNLPRGPTGTSVDPEMPYLGSHLPIAPGDPGWTPPPSLSGPHNRKGDPDRPGYGRPPMPMSARASFQGGGAPQFVNGNPAFGMATPGFQPGVDQLNPLAGVNEAVFGEETAGSKNPYYGLDFDQIEAISGGQWMPPQTGAQQPDYGNLQNSPQFGAAESSLSGSFGLPGYTPGSTTLGTGGSGPTAPAANAPGGGGSMGAPTMGGIVGGAKSPGAMGAAGATQGGLSRGQLANVFDQYFGGASPAQTAPSPIPPGHARGGRIGRQTGGPTATMALPINQGPWGVQSGGSGGGTQPAANSGMGSLGGSAGGPWTQMMGTPSAMNPSGNAEVGMANWAGFSGPQGMMEADAEGFRADGGGVDMNGRSGFQRGGFPQFTTYQPTATPARNPPTYSALDLSHLFGGGQQQQAPRAIQIQRQLGQARAKAAVQRGMVQPRVIARDPVTGEHHDITPQPDHPSTARYPGWPTPGPGTAAPDGLPMTAPRSVAPVGGQAPQSMRGPLQLSSRGPGMGYPARGIVPAEAAGTPEAGTLTNAAFRYPMPKQEFPARSAPLYEGGRGLTTTSPPLEGTQEWNKPSTNVEEPMDSREFQEAPTGRPLAAPRLVGADPMGQGHSLLAPHSMQALPPPSGDEAPMHTGWDVDLPGIFRGGGQGITEARGGRVPRYYGGRIGRDDGGSIPIGGGEGNKMEAPSGFDPSKVDWSVFDQDMTGGQSPSVNTSYGPQQPFSDMSDEQFARELQDEMRGSPSALAPSGGSSPQRIQMDPNAVAQTPSFQGAGGGGGGPHFTQVSNMGGPPISALDLSGHYTPTTGNARGATYVPGAPAISPNARAQAPEHPAITTMRHIVRTHDALRARGSGSSLGTGIVDPSIVAHQNMAGPGPMDPSIIAHQNMSPMPDDPGAEQRARLYHKLNPTGSPIGKAYRNPNYQGGGGVMGSSPVGNAGGYTPQGEGVTGQTSQGRGVGFGDLFGGGDRAGFAAGGLPSAATDPFLAAITASMPQSGGGGGGHGPPAPPPPAPPPPAGQDPTKGLGDSLDKLGTAAKKFMGKDTGNQTAPTGSTGSQPYLTPDDQSQLQGLNFSPQDTSAINAGTSGDLFSGALDPSNFADSSFFQSGGGVGLGSLRGGFSDGGTPDATDAPSGFDQAVTGAAPPVAGPPPAGGGLATAKALRDHMVNTYGLTPDQATGFVGTLGYESGDFKTLQEQKPVGGGRGGYGWAQWTGPRRDGFEAYAQANNLDPSSPAANQGYLDQELHGKYAGALDEIRKTGSVADAAKATLVHFEGMPDTPEIRAQGGIPATQGHIDRALAYDKALGGSGTDVANIPSGSATPASATTESYGGGFQIPPGGAPPGQLDRNNLQAPTMGDELKHDPGGYLMSVGAAMMASRSPWLGVGIGEGLVAGNNYLQQQKTLEKDWGTAQANINNLSQEARDHGADADLKAQQLQIGAVMNKIFIERARQRGLIPGGSGGSAAPGAAGGPGQPGGGLTPVQPLGGGAAPSGAPSGSSAPSGSAPSGSAPAGGITDLNQDPDYIVGTNLIAQGKQDNQLRPGFGDDEIAKGTAQAEAAKAAWEKKAEIAAKGQEAVTSATTDAQKPILQAYLEDRRKFEGSYDTTRSEISELSNIYQHFQAGRSSEAKAELASWANAFGFKFDQAASSDAAMKSAIQQAFAAVANSGLQKAPRAGLREATMMVASPTRDPAALRKILTDQLATLDYQHDMYSNVPGHNLNVDDDIEGFTKKAKYSDYLNKARKEVPIFKGITPETMKNVTGEDWPGPVPKTGAQPGERYSLPNGKVVRAQPDGSFQVEYEP